MSAIRKSFLFIILCSLLVGCDVVSPTTQPTLTSTVLPVSTDFPTKIPTQTASPTPALEGNLLAYLSTRAGRNQIFTANLEDGTQNQITASQWSVYQLNWTPDGRSIIFGANMGEYYAIFSVDWNGDNLLNLSGVEDSIDGEDNLDDWYPSLSPDGTKIAYFSRVAGYWALYTMKIDGTGRKRLTDNTVYESLATWSPDGNYLAFNVWHNTMQPPFIASVGVNGENYTELSLGELGDHSPKWSPDGSSILFITINSDGAQIYSVNPDGTYLHKITDSVGKNGDPEWSPDGKQIVFVSTRESPNIYCHGDECNFDIYVMNADGSNQVRITNDPANDWNPIWSSDGTMIAFQSLRDETRTLSECLDQCNSEIYIMNADGSGIVRITDNTLPDEFPVWQPSVKK